MVNPLERARLWLARDRAEREGNATVLASAIGTLYQSTPAIVGNLLCAVMFGYAAYQVVPAAYLGIWLSLIVGISIGRWVLKRVYWSKDVAPEKARQWGFYYAAGAGLSGIAWGAAALVVLQSDAMPLHTVIAVFIAGLVAGSATSASSFLPAFYAFMVPPIASLAAAFFLANQNEHVVLGLVTLLFAGLVTSFARRMNRTLSRTQTLRVRNETLVRELRAALQKLKSADGAKSDFLANMSHEMRTPLNAIIGFSGMMRAEALGPIGSPKYAEYANDIHESGAHLLALITDVLDVSKIEAGQGGVLVAEIDIAAAIESCITLVKEQARSGSVELRTEIASALPPLFADELKFKQILINLLSNAVKFTPAGGSVTVSVDCDEVGEFVFQVIDTGIGIARYDIPNAMTAFRQIENGTGEGTGLGLPLARALAELHGGTLSLESEVGVGTVVTLRLPASCADAATDDSPVLFSRGRRPAAMAMSAQI